MKKMFFPAVLAALSVSVFTARSATAANGSLTPHFKQSSYVNESVTLENKYVTMNFFKRIKGWGWGEILTPEGKLMAVMDHLGGSGRPTAKVSYSTSNRWSCARC